VNADLVNAEQARPLRVLHCHSTFSLGGKEARAVRLMNVFGDRAQHTILSAVPDALGARDAIDPGIAVDFPGDRAPSLQGKPSPGRYRVLTRYMQGFDLVLTYNWGSMDAVGARRLFPKNCPRLIHHEDGFNADEAERLNWKRNAFRRLMLPAAQALVVPSQTLERIARTVWHQGEGRVHRIPNGIPVSAYAAEPQSGAIPGLNPAPGDVIIGTLAGLRAVKDLVRMVRAVAPLPKHVKLVIVGEGPERAGIEAAAAELGMADRLIMAGFMAEPQRFIGCFDIFALSSQSEQFPISVVEAMAAGLPIVSTDVGDVAAIVATENRSFIDSDELNYRAHLLQLSEDADQRKHTGAANRAKAAAEFDEAAMISRYRALYGVSDH
jgi:L-malate glycosyltransferase